MILLEDFNLHHPSWGGEHISTDNEANSLVEVVNSFELNLLLPCREITWQRTEAESTINLVFSTSLLTQRLITCQVRKDWGTGDDHNPIALKFNTRL